MAKNQKALISFGKYSDSVIITICQFILAAINGNANFPDPTPKLVTLTTLLTDYIDALNACGTRDRTKIAVKNALRRQLNDAFNQLGVYVNMTCMGDAVMLATSGFKLSKIPEPVHIGVPANLEVFTGANPGSIKASIKRVAGATSYLYQVSEDANVAEPVWQTFGSPRSKYIFENLVPGKTYYVRVVALGANGQSTYSSVAIQVASVTGGKL